MKHRKGHPYFDLKEAARYLDVTAEQLIDRLFEGGGPVHKFDGVDVLYRPVDLDYFRLLGGRA